MPSWKKIIVENSDASLNSLIINGTYQSLDTATQPLVNYTARTENRVLSTGYLYDFADGRSVVGDAIVPSKVTANQWDLVHCTGSAADSEWKTVNQSTNSATKLLGIYDGTNVILEGYVTIVLDGEGSDVPRIDTLQPGKPIYIMSGSAGRISTQVPNTGYVRILGHVIDAGSVGDGNDYAIMKFRPDHTWIQI